QGSGGASWANLRRPFGQHLGETRPKSVGRQLTHAGQVVTPADIAGAARDRRGDRSVGRAIWTVPPDVGASIGSDPRPAERGGEVEGPAVVREDDVGAAEDRGELRQRRPAAEIERRSRQETGTAPGQYGLVAAAHEHRGSARATNRFSSESREM